MNLTKNLLMGFGLLLLIHLKCIWSQARFYATKTATKCFALSGESDLKFSPCKPGHLILIEEAFQGISQDPVNCEYQWGDCIMPVVAETEARLYKCIGSDTCVIPVSQGYMPKCGDYSSYITVIYKCIAKEDISDICRTKEKQIFRSGYIKSYMYPEDYAPKLECQCNITTEFDQKILLSFTDFAVEWSENCFSDVLEIRDGYYEYARCGRLPRNHNITSQTNKMELTFKTDMSQEHKGFWLQVEALGDMKITCASKYQLPAEYYSTNLASTTTTTNSPPTTETPTTQSPTLISNTKLRTFRNGFTTKRKTLLNPTKNIPIFGSTNYKVPMTDVDFITKDAENINKYERDYENEVLKPTVVGIKKNRLINGRIKNNNNKIFDNIGQQFDLLLTQDLLSRYVTNWDKGDLEGQIGVYGDIDGDFTTEEPQNEQLKPTLVISPTIGIIIGCVLLVILILVVICICVWRKKHRKKKHITKSDRNEPRLTKHSFPVLKPAIPPHMNSPRPTTSQLNSNRQHYPSDDLSENYSENMTKHPAHRRRYPSDNASEQYPEGSPRQFPDHVVSRHFQDHTPPQSFPDSPASARSYESENSFESGRSGIRRGERVKKHYKRSRMSPRLDTAHFHDSEEMQLQ